MQARESRRYSVEEYFVLDEAAPEGVRLEYDEGMIYLNGQPYDPAWGWEEAQALAGGQPEHNRLKDRIARLLGNVLDERGCDVVTSDQRVAVSELRYTYPDVVVACNPSYDGVQLTNPQLIVEVLSPGSVERDLRLKLQQYQEIASLEEYWIISTAGPSVTRYFRFEHGWGVESYASLKDTIESKHLGMEVALEALYPRL